MTKSFTQVAVDPDLHVENGNNQVEHGDHALPMTVFRLAIH